MTLGTKEIRVVETDIFLEWWEEGGLIGHGQWFNTIEEAYKYIAEKEIVDYEIWSVVVHETRLLKGVGGICV